MSFLKMRDMMENRERSEPQSIGGKAKLNQDFWIVVTVSFLLVVWPRLIDGRLYALTDTDSYYCVGDWLLHVLGGGHGELITREIGGFKNAFQIGAQARSPLFAIPLVIADRFVGASVFAGVLAVLDIAVYVLAIRVVLRPKNKFPEIVGLIVLIFATPFAIVANLLMPDILIGGGFLSLFLLIRNNDDLSRGARALCWVVLFCAAATHTSHALAVLGLLVAMVLWSGVRGALTRRTLARGAIALIPCMLPFVTPPVLSLLVREKLHDEITSPPFLMARVLEDGPGRMYLPGACATGEFPVLCSLRRTRIDNSSLFLWADADHGGAFQSLNYDKRLRLVREERRFVLGTVSHYPVQTLSAALRNSLIQATKFRVGDPLFDPNASLRGVNAVRWSEISHIFPSRCSRLVGECQSRINQTVLNLVVYVAVLLSLVFLGIAIVTTVLFREAIWRIVTPSALEFLTFAALFICLNAVICGTLSAPTSRYQARIVWLLPAIAAACVCRIGRVQQNPKRSTTCG